MNKLMYALCIVFIVSTSALAGEGHTRVDTLSKSSRSWDGALLPDYPKGTPEITILRITIPPGAQLPMHQHPMINAGILLSGELTVVTEDSTTLRLKAGATNIEVVKTWHFGKNEGTIPAVIIVFYAGTHGMPMTIPK